MSKNIFLISKDCVGKSKAFELLKHNYDYVSRKNSIVYDTI